MALIELKQIRKVYGHGDGETVALDDISLEIEKGEFVAIVGPSGCGKSTLMHIMGLLDEPSEGVHYLDGRDVSELSQAERARVRLKKAGFVFQMFNLLSRITALENVALPMAYAGKKQKNREKHARELLERVGLADRLDHYPTQLSGGQMQRVAIARALVNKPDILLADEPTGNLDSKSGAEVLKLLTELNKEGTTLVMVTHDPTIASAAKRTITMLDGVVTDDTKKKKTTKKPKTKSKPKKVSAKSRKKATKKTVKKTVKRGKS